MSREYATAMLDYLYCDGDSDYVFFKQIMDVVAYDDDDNPFEKSDDKRFGDAITLAEFLVKKGDFIAVRMEEDATNARNYVEFSKCMDDFRSYVNHVYVAVGLEPLWFGIRLLKMNHNPAPEDFPAHIASLFA